MRIRRFFERFRSYAFIEPAQSAIEYIAISVSLPLEIELAIGCSAISEVQINEALVRNAYIL